MPGMHAATCDRVVIFLYIKRYAFIFVLILNISSHCPSPLAATFQDHQDILRIIIQRFPRAESTIKSHS